MNEKEEKERKKYCVYKILNKKYMYIYHILTNAILYVDQISASLFALFRNEFLFVTSVLF